MLALSGFASWVAAVVFSIIGFTLTSLAAPYWTPVIVPVTVTSVVVALLGFVVLALLSKAKGAEEAQAGYTTATRLQQELAQVDNLSGVIIREAGEPFLAPREMRQAYREARSIDPS